MKIAVVCLIVVIVACAIIQESAQQPDGLTFKSVTNCKFKPVPLFGKLICEFAIDKSGELGGASGRDRSNISNRSEGTHRTISTSSEELGRRFDRSNRPSRPDGSISEGTDVTQEPPKELPQGPPKGLLQELPQRPPKGPPKEPPKGLPQGPPKGLPQGPPKGLPQRPPKGPPKEPPKGLPQGSEESKERPQGLWERPSTEQSAIL